jgi:hypothetical protein
MDSPFPDGMMPCIEEFFEAIHSYLVPGQDIYPEVFQTSLFFPLQRQQEMAWMQSRARLYSPKVVMEIGADKGGSLYHWCMCQPTVEVVIACEIRGTPYARCFEKAFPTVKFIWLEKSSYESSSFEYVKTELRMLGKQIDCLFIDGDKGEFLKDFYWYALLMNHPSVVFMHDVNGSHIKDTHTPEGAFHRLYENGYKVESYISTTDYITEYMKEKKGLPPENPHAGWLRHWKGNSCGVGQIHSP